ncbi:MAG TPA: hypothetical protein VGL09_00915 [Methylomirabilota bacterium]|jgi:hypothetical protein
MRLITAHRILIGCGIAFFLLYAALELRRFYGTGSAVDLVVSALAAAVAVAFILYYRTLSRWGQRRP